MNVRFTPIAPDTTSSLKPEIVALAEKYGIADYLEKCFGFGGVVSGEFPQNDATRNLIRDAKKICVVSTVW